MAGCSRGSHARRPARRATLLDGHDGAGHGKALAEPCKGGAPATSVVTMRLPFGSGRGLQIFRRRRTLARRADGIDRAG